MPLGLGKVLRHDSKSTIHKENVKLNFIKITIFYILKDSKKMKRQPQD